MQGRFPECTECHLKSPPGQANEDAGGGVGALGMGEGANATDEDHCGPMLEEASMGEGAVQVRAVDERYWKRVAPSAVVVGAR